MGHISMQRLQPLKCTVIKRLVRCSGWVWHSFMIPMQTPPDARRWGIISYSNAVARNIECAAAAAAVQMFVPCVCVRVRVCLHALLRWVLSLWCKVVSVTTPPQGFHLALSDYISERDEWNPNHSRGPHGSAGIRVLLCVLFFNLCWRAKQV